MKNKILCSTGAILGRVNNFNLDLFLSLYSEIEADAFEFMTEKEYEGQYDDIAAKIKAHNIPVEVVHTLKDIGIYLAEKDKETVQKGLDIFFEHCRFAKSIAAKKVVLHLWSGLVSDSKIENNISQIDALLQIAKENDVELLIENVPCTTHTPIDNIMKILQVNNDVCFTFDTRFAAFHSQLKDEKYYSLVKSKNIRHVHISDFGKTSGDFTALRPILHPGEGKIDFDFFFRNVVPYYDGAFNLESPVFSENGIDIKKLNESLNFIRKMVEQYSK